MKHKAVLKFPAGATASKNAGVKTFLQLFWYSCCLMLKRLQSSFKFFNVPAVVFVKKYKDASLYCFGPPAVVFLEDYKPIPSYSVSSLLYSYKPRSFSPAFCYIFLLLYFKEPQSSVKLLSASAVGQDLCLLATIKINET